MSNVDRVLVERFRQAKHIPRPKVLPRASLPSLPQTTHMPPLHKLQIPVPQQAEFMRFPTPPRMPPHSPRRLSPATTICLKRVYRTVKQLSTRDHFLEYPLLKKVDNTPKNKPKVRRAKRWIPRWRRKSSVAFEEENGNDEEPKSIRRRQVQLSSNSSKTQIASKLENTETLSDKLKILRDSDSTITEIEVAGGRLNERQMENQPKRFLGFEENREKSNDEELEKIR
ncbi:unnamed protein product, partial [Strongylus vulgaris]